MDDMETVTVEPPSVDESDWLTSWDSGFSDPTLQNINFDPNSIGELSSVGAAAEGGSGGFGGSISSILQALGGGRGILSDASGIMGLLAANNLKDLAGQALSGSNPFGPYRDQYAQQLNTLMANPGSVTSDPGFTSSRDQALQQVQKSMAAQGYKGSGNMAAALYDRSNNFQLDYTQQKENQLANLAGANINPNYGPGLQGAANAAQVQSSGLASLGAGMGYALPQAGLGIGSASAGTPLGMSPTGTFNSAGGEAASALGVAGGLLSTLGKAGSVVNSISPEASPGSGGLAGSVSSIGGIATGLAKGGAVGYAQAAGNAGKLYNQTTGNTGGIAGTLGKIGSAVNVYQGLTSGTPQGTVSGLASGAGLAASSGAAAGMGASASMVAALGASATGIGVIAAIPAVVSGVGDLIFGKLLGADKPDKTGNELSILRNQGGVKTVAGTAGQNTFGLGTQQKDYYGEKELDARKFMDPANVQKASDLYLSGDKTAYSDFMNSLLLTTPSASATTASQDPSKYQIKPVIKDTGSVMSQLAFGMQNQFRGLQHA